MRTPNPIVIADLTALVDSAAAAVPTALVNNRVVAGPAILVGRLRLKPELARLL